MRQWKIVVAAAALLFACGFLHPSLADAQVLYGSIVGNVEDSSGATLPGATVTITSRETNLARSAVSNEVGAYSFTNVQAGTYDVKVSLQGFKESVKTAVPVSVNTVSRVDARLDIGQLSETVTVQSESQLLQTDKADTHTEIKSEAITQLPLQQNRNYQTLINLVPGATPGPTAEQRSRYAGSRADDERQRSEPQQQRHEDRWCDQREHLAAAPHDAGLAGRDRRHGQREHEQLRRRAGHGRRCGDHGHHQVGHERVQGVGVRVLQQREDERVALLRHGEEAVQRAHHRRDARRPDHEEQAVLLRVVGRAVPETANQNFLDVPPAALRVGDFSQAFNSDGSLQVIYDPTTGNPDGTGRTPFAGNRIPGIDPIAAKIQALFPNPNVPGIRRRQRRRRQHEPQLRAARGP